MQKLAALGAVLALLDAAGQAHAACGSSSPLVHQISYFQCVDNSEVAAFAYQASNAAVNTGTEKIACESVGLGSCISGGAMGDWQVQIQSDWGNGGIVGCPAGPPPQRVILTVQCNDGKGVVVSLSGASLDFGY